MGLRTLELRCHCAARICLDCIQTEPKVFTYLRICDQSEVLTIMFRLFYTVQWIAVLIYPTDLDFLFDHLGFNLERDHMFMIILPRP